ncbi:ataxin-10 [Protopterus annectens]|uniref:ataxin-10 n=1 Tax=Protopterus annectens TaxID=7888 RepID=UPI001CFBCE1E|nr:ataxin-10 [Protopterus annectens]
MGIQPALRCGLQFLGNAASGNRESQDCIWKHAFPSLFLNYLNHADEKASAYCSMVLYSCLDDQKLKDLQNNANGLNVALSAVRVCGKQPDLDWAIWIVTDYFLTSPELVEAIYSRMTSQERIFFLELIIAKLGEKKCGTDAISANTDIPLKLVEFLAHCFQENCKAVLCFAADAAANENEEALVVVRLLDCLCEISSCHEKYECLQTQPGLLEDAIEILQQTHLIGKLGGNVFSISHSPSRVEQVLHPAEGFKAHVIRLIGNLCYRNRENQDRIYLAFVSFNSLKLFNVFLNSYKVMNQWAVFAIRNLTEHNRENQEVISKMDRLGLADTSFLRSMGLDVQEREGTLMLKSLKKGQ